ncbi:MAG TPA: hypothetical protein VMT21_05520 [Gemmatimonadales bacterium]|nr:hypothetical protein [Gemmatimonadales bacterium]
MRRALVVTCVAALAACTSELPPGTTSFTLGRTTVRTDSTLDITGLVLRLADSTDFPTVGPLPKWKLALGTELGDSAFTLAEALGPMPVGPVLSTWAALDARRRATNTSDAPPARSVPGASATAPTAPDSACGWLAAGVRRCFGGDARQRRALGAFINAAAAFVPRAAPLALAGLGAPSRLQDLSDVYTALSGGRALDSVVATYTGYHDQSYDVMLARTFWPRYEPPVDLARWTPALGNHVFLGPDPTFPDRSYRSPGYVWLTLGHQMAHFAVQRLFAEHPELLQKTVKLRAAVEGDMARTGYPPVFWDEELGEQLARAITVRALQNARPTLTWAARTEALSLNMALVPWLEDALQRYEKDRARYPTLSAFAGELATALDDVQVDSCRAAPSPGVALLGVARDRAVVGWLADDSPFRARGLAVGDTVLTIDGDSVSAGDLLTPTRQIYLTFAQHLPAELAALNVKRGARVYGVDVPIRWVSRATVRVASQARSVNQKVSGEWPICTWVRRAVRP